MSPRRISVILAAVSVLTGCASAQKQDLSRLVTANPRSILVVPAVNRSVEVDAPDYLLSTLTIPIAERGYYVFPVNLVKRVLEDDGLSDADMVHQADATRLCSIFGADAVMLVTIERWDAKYMVLTTQVTVGLGYVLKDGKTGEVLWTAEQAMTYQPSGGGGGGLGSLIAAAVNAAVTKAAPNYMPLARQATANAMLFPGPGLPAGPYRPEYRQDVSPAATGPAPAGS